MMKVRISVKRIQPSVSVQGYIGLGKIYMMYKLWVFVIIAATSTFTDKGCPKYPILYFQQTACCH